MRIPHNGIEIYGNTRARELPKAPVTAHVESVRSRFVSPDPSRAWSRCERVVLLGLYLCDGSWQCRFITLPPRSRRSGTAGVPMIIFNCMSPLCPFFVMSPVSHNHHTLCTVSTTSKRYTAVLKSQIAPRVIVLQQCPKRHFRTFCTANRYLILMQLMR